MLALRLLACSLQVLADSKAKEALSMNNDYFSGLLDRMIQGM